MTAAARRWRRWYTRALRAFPAEFRDRWGEEMTQAFADRLAATPGPLGALAAREIADVLGAGLRERGARLGRSLRLVHLADLRQAVRLLGRSPGFALLTILVLAGGLGLCTYTFSFLHTAMIRPLPLDEGDRIVRIDPTAGGRVIAFDASEVSAFSGELSTLTEIGAFGSQDVVVGRDGDRRAVDAVVIDPILFSVARVPPLLGRTLLPADAVAGAEPVIVVSYRTWELAFGRDRAIVDRHATNNGKNTRVVGVMPEGFGFPIAAEAWLPLPAERSARPGESFVRLAGRLVPGATRQAAAAEATVAFQRLALTRDPASRADTLAVAVESFPAAQIGEERTLAFLVLNLLAALILVLALVNVTNLLLARVNERARETAVRMALGASTGRLVIQGMWETVLLCLVGGILGTALAAWGLDATTRWTRVNMEGNLAFWWVWQMDRVTVLVAGGFVTAAIGALGTVVSRQALRTNVREVLADGNARGGSRRTGRLARLLVMVQVATVTVLMFFGALAGVVARRVMTLDPGYEVTNLLQGGVLPPPGRYPTPEARAALFAALDRALVSGRAFDGVLLHRTLGERHSPSGRYAVRDAAGDVGAPTAHLDATLGDLRTVGVSIVEGRGFADTDAAGRTPVALVSRSLAARHWPGRSPVGEQIRPVGVGDTAVWRTIVGVTSDVLHGDPLSRDRSPDAIYLPLLQEDGPFAVVIARHRSTDVAGRAALMDAFGATDPLLIPDGVQPFSEVLRKSGLIALSVAKLFGACFAFALLLAVVGTYGLMSRSIGSRRSEIGIRRALGASDRTVQVLLLRQGARQLAVGTLVAAPVLVAVGAGFLHYVRIGLTLTVALGVGVSVAIVAVVLAATWVPTRRALRVPPRDALLG